MNAATCSSFAILDPQLRKLQLADGRLVCVPDDVLDASTTDSMIESAYRWACDAGLLSLDDDVGIFGAHGPDCAVN